MTFRAIDFESNASFAPNPERHRRMGAGRARRADASKLEAVKVRHLGSIQAFRAFDLFDRAALAFAATALTRPVSGLT